MVSWTSQHSLDYHCTWVGVDISGSWRSSRMRQRERMSLVASSAYLILASQELQLLQNLQKIDHEIGPPEWKVN